MSEWGHYRLTLECDGGHPPSRRPSDEYVADTRMEAKAMARDAGWLLTTERRKAFCPDCAVERRNTRRR